MRSLARHVFANHELTRPEPNFLLKRRPNSCRLRDYPPETLAAVARLHFYLG
jgi:hypothetical protein